MENTKNSGSLYLIPCPIAEDNTSAIPAGTIEALSKIDYFVVERLRSARRYIRSVCKDKDIDKLQFYELDKHGNNDTLHNFLNFLQSGHDIGLISEAGLPAIADPGQIAVAWAHKNKIKVVPLSGPSSIFLALMSSGLNGQQFCFNGYLSNKKPELIKELKTLENRVRQNNVTQIFMDTPYRNIFLYEACIESLDNNTLMCIACDIMGSDEKIVTQSIGLWKKTDTTYLNKQPAIFLLGRQ